MNSVGINNTDNVEKTTKSKCETEKIYECKLCKKRFDRLFNYNRHINSSKKCDEKNKTYCDYCKVDFENRVNLARHNQTSKHLEAVARLDKKQPKIFNIKGNQNKTISEILMEFGIVGFDNKYNTIINNNINVNVDVTNVFKSDINAVGATLLHDVISEHFLYGLAEKLIQFINLNPVIPQNHNMYVDDPRDNILNVYRNKDKTWEKKNFKDNIIKIIDYHLDELYEYFNEHPDCPKTYMDALKKKITIFFTLEEKDKKAYYRLLEILKQLLYKNKDVVLASHKAREKLKDHLPETVDKRTPEEVANIIREAIEKSKQEGL